MTLFSIFRWKNFTKKTQLPARVSRTPQLEVLEDRCVPSGYNFTTLDPPDSTFTQGLGINAAGHIVGDYRGADGQTHGFLRIGENYMTVDVPGSSYTQAFGINASDQIVGDYVAGGQAHGFLLSGGGYTTLDAPGSTFTYAYGINASGQIVGQYGDASGGDHGFVWTDGNWETVDVPGVTVSISNVHGITDAGEIVGVYVDAAGYHGYVRSGSTYTTLNAPGATGTGAWGINNTEQIVGWYQNADGGEHGFVRLTDGSYHTLDFPGSIRTDASGINDAGLIVGIYNDNHGYLATPTVSVQSVVINDGSVQRSMVNSLTVTFSTIVSLDPGAFEVHHQNGDLVTVNFTSGVVGGQTVAVLTFAGTEIIGGSLADGNYTLTVFADHVHDDNGLSPDANSVTAFYRLYGDTQGHRTVDPTDVAVLFSTFGKHAGDDGYVSYLDYNGDGVIDDTDLYAFIARYGTTLDPP